MQHLHQDLSLLRWASTTTTRCLRFRRRSSLFPNWFYFNIYEISSWSRAILVPLSIIYAKKPFKKLTPEQGIDELFVGGRENADLHLKWDRKRPIGWRNFFLFTDRMIHWFERVHIRPLRKMALKKAEKWMLERFEKSDGLGAIYPAMLNAIVALACLGYTQDDPQFIRAMDEFEKLGIDNPEGEAELSDSDIPHAAVYVAGVGHGAGRLRAGRGGCAEERSAPAEGGGLAAVQGSAAQGRLGRRR